MEKYIYMLNDYLPIDFDDSENNAYRDYLIETYIENCENGKFQFALMAFHMLFMTFMYKEFWGLKNYNFEVVKKLCDNNGKFGGIENIFDMSIIPELTTIDNFLSVFKWHINKKDAVKEFVNKRDRCAHASGFIQFEKDNMERHLQDVLDYAEKISFEIKNSVQVRFCKDLEEYFKADYFKTSLSAEYVDIILKGKKYSVKDIKYIFELDTLKVVNEDELGDIKVAYYFIMLALQEKYAVNTSKYELTQSVDYYENQLYFFIDSLDEEKYEKLQIQIEDEYYYLKDKCQNVSLILLQKLIAA